MEPQVRELGDEPLVALPRPGECGLEPFLAELARGGGRAGGDQAGDVRALRSRRRAFGHAPPEPGCEAGHRARVACRPGGPRPQQHRVAVAVLAQLLDGERVPGRLALVPEPGARAAVEVRLAGLPGSAQRFVVHPREHQDATRVGVLDDGGPELRLHRAAAPRGRGARSGASAGEPDARGGSTRAAPPARRRALQRRGRRVPHRPRRSRESRPRRRPLPSARGRSPSRVPSASIDVRRISPAPRASASAAQATASRPVGALPARV